MSDETFISFTKKQSSEPSAKRAIWGEEVANVSTIATVFVKYVKRELKKFPFSEGPLTAESDILRDALISLN